MFSSVLRMSQNRNKLLALFTGNIANSVVHSILQQAIEEEILRKHYEKEQSVSMNIALKYRQKINPQHSPLPQRDISYITEKIKRKVKAELNVRISRGYTNINLDLIEPTIQEFLTDAGVYN